MRHRRQADAIRIAVRLELSAGLGASTLRRCGAIAVGRTLLGYGLRVVAVRFLNVAFTATARLLRAVGRGLAVGPKRALMLLVARECGRHRAVLARHDAVLWPIGSSEAPSRSSWHSSDVHTSCSPVRGASASCHACHSSSVKVLRSPPLLAAPVLEPPLATAAVPPLAASLAPPPPAAPPPVVPPHASSTTTTRGTVHSIENRLMAAEYDRGARHEHWVTDCSGRSLGDLERLSPCERARRTEP